MAAGLFEKETAEVDFKENVLEHGGDEAALAIAELDSIEQTPVARFVWLVTITCSVAGALFGYDTGISKSLEALPASPKAPCIDKHSLCGLGLPRQGSRRPLDEQSGEGGYHISLLWWRLLRCHSCWCLRG